MRRRLLAAAAAIALTATGGAAAHATTDVPAPDAGPVAPLVEAPHSPGGVPSGPVGPSYLLWTTAAMYAGTHPGARPAGVNDFSCRPRPGTRPVVLVPGTGSDSFTAWSSFAPRLAAAGVCVYTFTTNPATAPLDESHGFSGDIRASATVMGTFVDRVLAATGADTVDVVGHSQGGGVLPRWYMRFGGGATKVNHLVGMSPNNGGTTYGGLATWLTTTGTLGQKALAQYAAAHNSAALPQQLVGSPLFAALDVGGQTETGVRYTVISTTLDTTLTPYTSTFIQGGEPGQVTNTTVQSVCPAHLTDHAGMPYDKAVQQMAINALVPDRTRPVTC